MHNALFGSVNYTEISLCGENGARLSGVDTYCHLVGIYMNSYIVRNLNNLLPLLVTTANHFIHVKFTQYNKKKKIHLVIVEYENRQDDGDGERVRERGSSKQKKGDE